jgi:hypothetical protein
VSGELRDCMHVGFDGSLGEAAQSEILHQALA